MNGIAGECATAYYRVAARAIDNVFDRACQLVCVDEIASWVRDAALLVVLEAPTTSSPCRPNDNRIAVPVDEDSWSLWPN